jgi:hypothetical protein
MGNWKLGYHTDNTYAKVTNDGAIVINNPITEIEKDSSGNKYDSYNEFNSSVLDFFVKVSGGSGEASWGGVSGNIEDQEDLTIALDSKVDKVDGKGLSTNDYTTVEKTKLAGIEAGANKYVHPTTHPASIIIQTEEARFVTDVEKGDWNSKETTEGSQTKATTALNSAKTYVDGKVLTDVPANAKFTDTTYSEITEAEINTGTASNLRTITARRVTFILSKVSALINSAIAGLTKASVGLGNVDNTSDANKPVSTAQAAAIALKIDANKFQVVTELPTSPVTGVFYFIKE